jgi:hypothetical protein
MQPILVSEEEEVTKQYIRSEESLNVYAPGYDEVALLAYSYWEERGRPDGSSELDWHRAETVLRNSGPSLASPVPDPAALTASTPAPQTRVGAQSSRLQNVRQGIPVNSGRA